MESSSEILARSATNNSYERLRTSNSTKESQSWMPSNNDAVKHSASFYHYCSRMLKKDRTMHCVSLYRCWKANPIFVIYLEFQRSITVTRVYYRDDHRGRRYTFLNCQAYKSIRSQQHEASTSTISRREIQQHDKYNVEETAW